MQTKLGSTLAIAALAATFAAPLSAHAQAADLPSAQSPQSAGTADQRGRALIDQMISAFLSLRRAELEERGEFNEGALAAEAERAAMGQGASTAPA